MIGKSQAGGFMIRVKMFAIGGVQVDALAFKGIPSDRDMYAKYSY